MDTVDLNNRVSRRDKEAINKLRNLPEYEKGFEDTGGWDDDSSGGWDDGSSGDWDDVESGGSGSNGLDIFGNSGGLGNNTLGGYRLGAEPQVNEVKESKADVIAKGAMEVAKSFWNVLKTAVKTVNLKSRDDIGYLCRNLMIVGMIAAAGATLLAIIGGIAKIGFLSYSGNLSSVIAGGLLSIAAGVSGITIIGNVVGSAEASSSVRGDIKNSGASRYEDDMEREGKGIFYGDESLWDDSDEEEDTDEDWGDGGTDSRSIDSTVLDKLISSYKKEDKSELASNNDIDLEEKVDYVIAGRAITRKVLVDTFKEFLEVINPKFSEEVEIADGTDEYEAIYSICIKALANVTKVEIKDIKTEVESIYETMFSYKIRVLRVLGVKTDEYARELEVYFRENSSETAVTVRVEVESDFYCIVVSKGSSDMVTVGDTLRNDNVLKFFYDESNKLPTVVGVDNQGQVVLADARRFDAMLIAGKPRSGKSWYMLTILTLMMLFNTPEEVQFVLVDPKSSKLIKTLALMPHVCGVHDGDDIIGIMEDLINFEGKRRKRILEDNGCEDIWELRENGIVMPIVYLVIDEVMTIRGKLKDEFKDFLSLVSVIISQLPSQGIRILVIPHRSTGVIDKTNRGLIGFNAAINVENDAILETLNIKRWDQPLNRVGDIALKMDGYGREKFVRTAVLSSSNAKNRDLLVSAAKVFYKMGVEIPDMTGLGRAFNRDEVYVKGVLTGNGTIQYNANNVFDDEE